MAKGKIFMDTATATPMPGGVGPLSVFGPGVGGRKDIHMDDATEGPSKSLAYRRDKPSGWDGVNDRGQVINPVSTIAPTARNVRRAPVGPAAKPPSWDE